MPQQPDAGCVFQCLGLSLCSSSNESKQPCLVTQLNNTVCPTASAVPQQPDNLSVCFRAWGCAAATRASSLPTPSGSSPWLCCSLPSPICWDPRSAPMAPATGAPAWRMPRSVGYVCRPESASAGFQVTVTDTVQVEDLTGYACRVGQNKVGHLLSIAGTARLPFSFTAWLNQLRHIVKV